MEVFCLSIFCWKLVPRKKLQVQRLNHSNWYQQPMDCLPPQPWSFAQVFRLRFRLCKSSNKKKPCWRFNPLCKRAWRPRYAKISRSKSYSIKGDYQTHKQKWINLVRAWSEKPTWFSSKPLHGRFFLCRIEDCRGSINSLTTRKSSSFNIIPILAKVETTRDARIFIRSVADLLDLRPGNCSDFPFIAFFQETFLLKLVATSMWETKLKGLIFTMKIVAILMSKWLASDWIQPKSSP